MKGSNQVSNDAEVLRLQAVAPLAPLKTALEFPVQNLTLWLRRAPVAHPIEQVPETCSPTAALVGQSGESR